MLSNWFACIRGAVELVNQCSLLVMLPTNIMIYLGHKIESIGISMLFTNINNCFYFFCQFQNFWVGRTTINTKISGDGQGLRRNFEIRGKGHHL